MYKYLPCTMYRSLSKILWITRKIRSQFFVADEYHAWGKWGKWRILLEDLTTEQSSSQQLQMHYFQYFSFIKWEISNTIFLKKEIKDIFCKNLTKLGNKNKCPLHYRTGFANIYQSAICLTKLCKFFFSFLGLYILFVFVYTFGSVVNVYITCELFALLTYCRKDIKPTNIICAWKRFENSFIRNSAGNGASSIKIFHKKDKPMHI